MDVYIYRGDKGWFRKKMRFVFCFGGGVRERQRPPQKRGVVVSTHAPADGHGAGAVEHEVVDAVLPVHVPAKAARQDDGCGAYGGL